MPFSPVAACRRLPVIAIVAVLGLGLAACSSGDGDPKPKPEADKSSSAEPEPDWRAIAEDALASEKLPALGEYEAGDVEPEPDDEVPLQTCVGELPESVEVRAAAVRSFVPLDPGQGPIGGEPSIGTSAIAVDGSAATAFEDLREIWKSKKCASYEYTDGGFTIEYERVKELKAPKGVDADSWYGACYDGEMEAEGGGDYQAMGSGTCLVAYVSGEHCVSKVSVGYTVLPEEMGVPEDQAPGGIGDARKLVTTVAHEALAI